MGRKGGGGRKMAAAAAATAAALTTAVAARGGLRRRAGSTACGCFPTLLLAASLGLLQVSAVDIYTPAERSVENGTEAKLPCTFSSSEVISSAASVSWSFQAEGSTTSVSFFYYSNGKAYPGKSTQFKDRSSWAGDLNKKDASISIANMQFQDNGTYICDVKNPPDIEGTRGEIKVRVVEKGIVGPGNLTVFPTALVAGSIGGILGFILLIVLVVCAVYRKKNSEKHYSGDPDIDARLGM